MKTNNNALEKYNIESYPETGVYLNTDENSITEVLIAVKETPFVYTLYSGDLNTVVYEKLKNESKNEVLSEVKCEVNKVSEDFALKQLAIALGTYQIKD